jgi:acyl carrier protein
VVIGVKKPQSEEETITLILELDNNVKKEDLPKIKADALAINSTLPNEKKVQDILIYKRAMPISNSMKIKRFVLKDALEKGDFTDFMGFDDKEKVSTSSLFDKYDAKEVKSTLDTIRNIFAKTLLIPLFKVDNTANFSKDLGGDSMSYVGMVDDINKAFHLSIPTELYGRLVSVNDFALEILQLEHSKGSSKEKGQQK